MREGSEVCQAERRAHTKVWSIPSLWEILSSSLWPERRERAGQRCHGVDGDGLLGADEGVEASSCREGNP